MEEINEMNKIYLGKDESGENITLDFEEEEINFILLAGKTGSGKGIFDCNLYKQLSENNTSEDIGFIFMDMTQTDFTGWKSDYLFAPVITKPEDAIKVLHQLAEIKTDKKIFVHIEECDMVCIDREGVESALTKLRDHKNIYIIYSTSRLDPSYLNSWMKKFIDLKVVFSVSEENDSNFLLGNVNAYRFKHPGERILAFNNKQIHCQPFSNEEVEILQCFEFES